jgi:hypothetical protein
VSDDERVEETVEEEIEDRRTTQGPTGLRMVLCLVLVAAGIFAIVEGVIRGSTSLVAGGFVVAIVFGLVAVGSSRIGVFWHSLKIGAIFPARHQRARTLIRKRGFPKHGRSPLDEKSEDDRADGGGGE